MPRIQLASTLDSLRICLRPMCHIYTLGCVQYTSEKLHQCVAHGNNVLQVWWTISSISSEANLWWLHYYWTNRRSENHLATLNVQYWRICRLRDRTAQWNGNTQKILEDETIVPGVLWCNAYVCSIVTMDNFSSRNFLSCLLFEIWSIYGCL